MASRYRNGIAILGEVLRIASESEAPGVNHTALLRKANLSHANLRKTITKLLEARLIDEAFNDGQHIYSITTKGRDHLIRHAQFIEMTQAFGLGL